jgi:hypothetical protein
VARTARSKDSWHAVSIVAGSHACAAVQRLHGKRYLPAEAPRLPLTTCGHQEQCTCKYRHHPDRRADQRRSGNPAPGTNAQVPVKERRRPGERRERRS